jgi:hypothetical protein
LENRYSVVRSQTVTPYKPARDAHWVLGGVFAAILLAIVGYHYPTSDAAFFEYAGREISRGQHLYRDIWDNKLPGIYYVNALWHVMLGNHYAMHWAVEVAISLASIALFALFVKRDGLNHWGPATCVFAITLNIPTISFYDYTEQYAVLLILLGLVAAQARLLTVTGATVAASTFFWVPSVLMLVPLAWWEHTVKSRAALTMFCLASGAILIALCIWKFGAGAMHTLLVDMASYENAGFAGGLSLRLLHPLALSILGSGIAPLMFAAALAARTPITPRERFALVWLAAALAGIFVNKNFFLHYFLPSIAPLVYTIFAFGITPMALRTRWYVGVLFVLVIPVMYLGMKANVLHTFQTARYGQRIGEILGRSLPAHDVYILTYAYLPGVYLAADRRAPGNYANPIALNPYLFKGGQAEQRSRAYLKDAKRASAIVTEDVVKRVGSTAFFRYIDRNLVEVCDHELSHWHLYVLPSLQTKFQSCS